MAKKVSKKQIQKKPQQSKPNSEIVIEKLIATNLNTVNEYKALYPHWNQIEILKKMKNTLKNKDQRFVAKHNGKIVGQIKVVMGKGIHAHRAELTSLIVLPSKRGKGLGTALMNKAIDSLPKEIILIILSVDAKNKSAIKIYKTLGFKKYGLLKKGSKINGEFTNNLLMQKIK